MTNPWNLSEDELKEKSAVHTAAEICQQPEAWLETLEILEKSKAQIEQFVEPLLAKRDLQIVFTGAGTSAYVGDTIAPYLREKLGKRVDSIATTDIVANPTQFLEKHTPTVLVSFARSGDSPESIAAYDLAQQLAGDIHQIVITCNPSGTLARRAQDNPKNTLVIFTPKQTNDLGFAMTSSFTCMLTAGLMVFDMGDFAKNQAVVQRLAKQAKAILSDDHGLTALMNAGYERICFLGSGSLRGLAKEACLKVLELTSGKFVAVSESVMGFRHGPKSIINDRTIVVMLLSGDAYTRQYEMDFLNELEHDEGQFKVVALSSAKDEQVKALTDVQLVVDESASAPWAADAYIALGYIVFDHILALAASLAHGATPDNPRPDGSVNRVVKGVTIHPYPFA